MKTTILALSAFLILLSAFACNQKKAQNTTEPTSQTGKPTDPVSQPNVTETPAPPAAYQVVGFRKTACFGKCPVYEVKFFSDNTATWHGKMHVEKMGNYTAKLEGKILKDIRDKANEAGYLDFENEYPVGHKVADLPSTITYLRIGDMIKTIRNTHAAPEALIAYEAYLEGIINRLQWEAAAKE